MERLLAVVCYSIEPIDHNIYIRVDSLQIIKNGKKMYIQKIDTHFSMISKLVS